MTCRHATHATVRRVPPEISGAALRAPGQVR